MSSIQDRLSKDNPYNTFGKDNFYNANTGEEVRMVSENWDNPIGNGGVAVPMVIDKDSIWNNYIKKLPEQIIIQDLEIEMFGDNQSLINKYYKKPYMVQSIKLASLPLETLEFLVNKYNS